MKHYINKITKEMFGLEQNPNNEQLRALTDEEFEGWRLGTLNSYNDESDEFEFVDKRALETEKLTKYDYLKSERDKTLEVGTFFEETKLIKGRTQDLTDALAVLDSLRENEVVETEWYYSNGITENVNTEKMNQIYRAMKLFRSSQFGKEAKLKVLASETTTLAELDAIVW